MEDLKNRDQILDTFSKLVFNTASGYLKRLLDQVELGVDGRVRIPEDIYERYKAFVTQTYENIGSNEKIAIQSYLLHYFSYLVSNLNSYSDQNMQDGKINALIDLLTDALNTANDQSLVASNYTVKFTDADKALAAAMMPDYILLTSNETETLINRINRCVRDGYYPQGPLVVNNPDVAAPPYLQMMVRKKEVLG